MIRKWVLMLLTMLLATGCALAEEESLFYEEMPPYLRVQQKTKSEEIKYDNYVQWTYPSSSNEQVDAEIRALVDQMLEENRPLLPITKASTPSYLDVGSVITRTGTSWMSFLTTAEVYHERALLSTAFEARVYDMETGERILLTDVFPPESEAWDAMAQAVREQLTAAFPALEPDAAALDALCTKESLLEADFTLGAARLTLTYHAGTIYPGKNTLLHVHLYYPQIRPMMTERAFAQTDNSRFRMVALTFDDGGSRVRTRNVLDVLREYGAQASFFIVGKTMHNNVDMLSRQQNAAYSLQTHTYTHDYPEDLTTELAFAYKEQFRTEMADIIGVEPTMMRAPGGMEQFYINRSIDYPLIHWSLASGDSGSTDAKKVANRVIYSVDDGDIVLLHDTNTLCYQYTERILSKLVEQGILFVTLEELFADAGTELVNNRVYESPYVYADEEF